MNDTQPDPVQRYADLKQQIAQLEAELEAIKDEVFQAVEQDGGAISTDTFSLKTSKRPKYKFSETYEQKNGELKELRKQEIDDGIATIDGYSEYVTFRFKK